MNKIVVVFASWLIAGTVCAQSASTRPKIILSPYFAKSFEAGGIFYKTTTFAFGAGSTFAKDRMFVEVDMKLRDKVSFIDSDDSAHSISMSSIILRTGWNTRIIRAALISGPIVGPQIGYGFTQAGNTDASNNPVMAGLYLQFNLNYPVPLTLEFNKQKASKNSFYPGVFFRPSYNWLGNIGIGDQKRDQFQGQIDIGVSLLVE